MPNTTVGATKVWPDVCGLYASTMGPFTLSLRLSSSGGWGKKATGTPCLPGGVVKGPKGAGFFKEEACVALFLLLQQGLRTSCLKAMGIYCPILLETKNLN